jgi:glycosyltransferase involved in cell wall biosynthesis
MTASDFTLNIMTAALTPGDAVSNYVLTSARIWRGWGVPVQLYADYVAPALAKEVQHSSLYRPTGKDIIWYHYTIYADNVQIAMKSYDLRIMDTQSISPPHLFGKQNIHMQELCRKGIALLPDLKNWFEYYVVHTEYVRDILLGQAYDGQKIYKLPMAVDTTRFGGLEDTVLAAYLQKLDYVLFVGRLVPQKDIVAMVKIFAHLHEERPNMVLMLVGSSHLTEGYRQEFEALIAEKGLSHRVLFMGQVNDPTLLGTLLKYAKFHLITSEWESFCVPVAESMFFGVPPVVHHIPPLPEVAGPGGLVIDKQQPKVAADKMLALLEDEAAYEAMSQMAVVQAQQFTDKSLAEAIRGMMRSIANQQREVAG